MSNINYDVHTYLDIRTVAEILKALRAKDDHYQPANNSQLVRLAVEMMHEIIVPDKFKGVTTLEDAFIYLKLQGFAVPGVDKVNGTKRMRKLAKSIAAENEELEQTQGSIAQETSVAYLEALEKGEQEDEDVKKTS